MDIIRKQIGNAEFEFYLNSRGNRSGFVHECELFLGYEQIARAKRQYYNRTWERYRFQSVMLESVDAAIQAAKENIVEAEKARRGWAKLTAARRAVIEAVIEENSGIKALAALREDVYASEYGTEEERESMKTLDVLNTILDVLFHTEEPAPAVDNAAEKIF